VDDLRAAMKDGPVNVSVAAQGESPVEGQIAFIDNSIDVASGTIAVRATIPNDDERVWPGEFVNVTTILRIEPDAVVVPGAAVQMGQNGAYVFVIKSDQTVEVRPVTVERSQNGASVIAKGLAKGERVVTDGQLRLTAGTHVDERPAVASARSGEGV